MTAKQGNGFAYRNFSFVDSFYQANQIMYNGGASAYYPQNLSGYAGGPGWQPQYGMHPQMQASQFVTSQGHTRESLDARYYQPHTSKRQQQQQQQPYDSHAGSQYGALFEQQATYQQQMQGNGDQKDPLQNKVMVLYVLQNDPASLNAWSLVRDYEEILVMDVMAIPPHQRPAWLDGVPTVVTTRGERRVYKGSQAIQAISTYINTLKQMNGAQTDMVVPTVGLNDAFKVANKNTHYLACADVDSFTSIPLGTTTRTAMSVGRMEFPTNEDDARYNNTQKGVSDEELQAYIAMRAQTRQRPVQLKPSVLENGEFVTM